MYGLFLLTCRERSIAAMSISGDNLGNRLWKELVTWLLARGGVSMWLRSTEPACQTAHERHARRDFAPPQDAAHCRRPLRPRLGAFSGHFCAGRWTR